MNSWDIKNMASSFFGFECPKEFVQEFINPIAAKEKRNEPDVKKRPILVPDVLPIKHNGNSSRSNRKKKIVKASVSKPNPTKVKEPKRNHARMPFGRSGYNPSF